MPLKVQLDILDRMLHMVVLIAISIAITGVFDIREGIKEDSRARFALYADRLDRQIELLVANREATIAFAPQIARIVSNQMLMCEELQVECELEPLTPYVPEETFLE